MKKVLLCLLVCLLFPAQTLAEDDLQTAARGLIASLDLSALESAETEEWFPGGIRGLLEKLASGQPVSRHRTSTIASSFFILLPPNRWRCTP